MKLEKMKRNKSVFSFFMAAVLLGCSMFSGCAQNGGALDSELNYKVTVNDPAGAPCTSGVIVCFYQGETQVAMQPCAEQGIAEKKLPAGDYTVKLQFTGDANAYHYIEDGLTLSKDKTELTISLIAKPTGEGTVLSVRQDDGLDIMVDPTMKDYTAYNLSVGKTYVEVTPGDKTYFLFMPTQAGEYEFSIADGEGCTLSYFGNTSYVTYYPAKEAVEGVTTLTVKQEGLNFADDTGTTVWVFGVETEKLTNCIISVVRVGDPEYGPEDEDWVIYETTAKLTQCTLPEGKELKNFDLMAESYTIVYNENDGFYHKDSADGPLVYVYLTENTKYVDCFKAILDNSTVRAYVYDENGKFVKKEAYGTCLKEYFEYVDDTAGVYPLTNDLKYIIQTFGEKSGWWNPSSKGYLFTDASGAPIPGVNNEIAWLMMCGYAE